MSKLATTGKYLGLCVIAFLSVRGAVDSYFQLQGSVRLDKTTITKLVDTGQNKASRLTTKEQRKQRADSFVAKMGEPDAKVVDVFSSATGLTGVVIKVQQGNVIGWMHPDVDAMVIGAVFDKTGNNINQTEMIGRGFAQPVATQKEQKNSMATIDKVAGFTEGTGGPTITAFIDLNCAFCSKFWRQSRQSVAAGKVKIKWVPVATLAPSSAEKAAAILNSATPLITLLEFETNQRQAGIPPNAATQLSIDANNAVLRMLGNGQMATPIMVIQDKTKNPVIIQGVPPSIEALIEQAV